MRMTRICMMSTSHPVLDTRIYYKEARTLAKNGYEITLIGRGDWAFETDGVRTIVLPKAEGRWKRLLQMLVPIARLALREQAHVYHFHDPELIPVGLFLKLLGKTVFYDVHENLPQQIKGMTWLPDLFRPPLALLADLIEHFSALAFDGIICATPSIGARFPTHKTVIIQNFPMVDEFCRIGSRPYSRREPVLLYLGLIETARGAREMIQAMDLLPDSLAARLMMAGRIMPPDLLQVLSKLPGANRTEFLGQLARDSLPKLMGTARIGLVLFHPAPNHYESYPTKFFEYMSAGLPIIVSDFDLWRRIVQDAGCGLVVNPLEPYEIAAAVIRLLTDTDEAEAMGRRGRRAVEEIYNWENEARKLVDFYRNHLGRKGIFAKCRES